MNSIAAIMLAPEPFPRRVTIAAIVNACAKHYGIVPGILTQPDCLGARYKWISRKRQMAMFLARELTHASLEQIGGYFGHRDHTTVMHGCRQVKKLLAEGDYYTSQDVRAIMQSLGALELPGVAA
jgi:chromosomal replication initiator protein